MNDTKLLKMYLGMIGGKLRFISGGLVAIEYNHDSDIYDSYLDMIYYIKLELKKAGAI